MENNPFDNPVAKKDFNGYWIPSHNAKVFKNGLMSNNAPFFPDDMGHIKATPIYNASTGYCLPAGRLLPVQFARQEKGYFTNVVGGFTAINQLGSSVKEGEKGVFYNFRDEEGVIHTSSLFFAEQTTNPDEFLKRAGANLKPVNNLSVSSLEITSGEPVEYLAQYVAACKGNLDLTVNPVYAVEFKRNIMPIVENDLKKYDQRNKDMPSLGSILFDADKRSTEILKGISQTKGVTQETQKGVGNEMCF